MDIKKLLSSIAYAVFIVAFVIAIVMGAINLLFKCPVMLILVYVTFIACEKYKED